MGIKEIAPMGTQGGVACGVVQVLGTRGREGPVVGHTWDGRGGVDKVS